EELFPEAFVEKLNEERVEVLQLTPSRLQQLETAFAEQAPHSLQHLLVGGEAFPEFLVEALSQFPDLAVTNVYGPTETTIWSTFSKVTADQPIRIGRAFFGEQVFILNDAHKLQAIGVAGEICIGGHGVARGYHNRPELSAQKFIPHPFHPKQRLYKTGDLGYWTSDGQLVFQGRKDHQVKIRGHRIELGEIEQSLLRSVPEMIQVAVVVRERNEAQLLAAFYSLKEPVEKSLLRDLLQDQLPDYMLPNYFVEMEELPLTPSGKINRNALPAILDDDSIRREFVPPANELESQLMAQWKEVLQIHQLGVIDNFFEVGGNSILVVRLYQRIKAHLLDDIRITDLFSHASIRRQAELIASRTQPDAAVLQINEIDF
ncbi:MAG: non-ribosomal peptide synthetase, partial [Bacteroidota bacterium]